MCLHEPELQRQGLRDGFTAADILCGATHHSGLSPVAYVSLDKQSYDKEN